MAEETAIPRKKSMNPGHLAFLVKYNRKMGAIHAAIPIFQLSPENVYAISPKIRKAYLVIFFCGFISRFYSMIGI
jgi:hypothetical protein